LWRLLYCASRSCHSAIKLGHCPSTWIISPSTTDHHSFADCSLPCCSRRVSRPSRSRASPPPPPSLSPNPPLSLLMAAAAEAMATSARLGIAAASMAGVAPRVPTVERAVSRPLAFAHLLLRRRQRRRRRRRLQSQRLRALLPRPPLPLLPRPLLRLRARPLLRPLRHRP
jgi:hypothetical protein